MICFNNLFCTCIFRDLVVDSVAKCDMVRSTKGRNVRAMAGGMRLQESIEGTIKIIASYSHKFCPLLY